MEIYIPKHRLPILPVTHPSFYAGRRRKPREMPLTRRRRALMQTTDARLINR